MKQIQTTLDYYVYTPDDTVVEGEIEAGKLYDEPDFNKNIEIREREKKRVEIFMSQINQNEKTLVFCANQAHALLVRDLIDEVKKSSERTSQSHGSFWFGADTDILQTMQNFHFGLQK